VRVLGGGEALKDWLSRRSDVQDPSLDGELVRFRYGGNRQNQAELLKQMVLAGFQVAEFTAQRKSLEDVFLQVTRGAVQ